MLLKLGEPKGGKGGWDGTKLHFKSNGGYYNIGSFLCVLTPWPNPMKVHKPYSQVYNECEGFFAKIDRIL
jgi:hypothetical protein